MKHVLFFAFAVLLLVSSGPATASTLYCWGHGNYGQLGNGSGADVYSPTEATQVTNLGLNPVAVDVGDFHTCILNDNGTVWCFGHGGSGQLGNLQNEEYNFVPSQVRFSNGTALTGIIKVVTGAYHTCALREDHTVWCWGSNALGQLGMNRTSGGSNSPVRVVDADSVALSGVVDIDSAGDHTCALASNGTVWCWGWNYYGQIGDGLTDTYRYYASRVKRYDGSILTGVVEIGTGGSHTCALASNGTVWCWGWNGSGQLGDGTAVNRYQAVQVKKGEDEFLTGVVRLVVGRSSSWAFTENGSLYCWGSNYYGQLATSTEASNPYAIPMTAISVSEITSGTYSTFAISTDGYTYSWGTNKYGHLGLGDLNDRTEPTKIPGHVFNKLAEAPYIHMCAISGLPTLAVSPSSLVFTRPGQTQTVSVTNSGAEITSVTSSDSSVFEIRNDNCTGSSSDCSFDVVFKPGALTDYSGAVTISYGGGLKTVPIEARLSTEAESPVPCPTVSSSSEFRGVGRAFLIVIRNGNCIGN